MTAAATRRGVTLIEMMVYVAVVSVVTMVAMLTYLTCWDHAIAVHRVSDDIVRTLEAGERWRDDVRGAAGPPTLAEGVLRVPHQGGDVLYRLADDTVERKAGAGEWAQALAEVKASRMLLDEGKHVRSWRWELELQVRKKKARLRPLFTFRAVAGG